MKRLPTGIYEDADDFAYLIRDPDTDAKMRAALELAFLDVAIYKDIRVPFYTYPREAFLAIWDTPTPRDKPAHGGQTFHHYACPVIRLLHLVGFAVYGRTLKEYENQLDPGYKCEECRAGLRRIARAWVKSNYARRGERSAAA
jgi:hypothetical protein